MENVTALPQRWTLTDVQTFLVNNDVNCCVGGTTVLREAVKHASDESVIDYLLSVGANPRARNDLGQTAAMLAQTERDTNLRPLSLKRFFPLNDEMWMAQIVHNLDSLFFLLSASCVSLGVKKFSKIYPPTMHATLLAPLNTFLREAEETYPRNILAGICATEGIMSFSYFAKNVVASQTLFFAVFLSTSFCLFSQQFLNREAFNITAIHYISPIAKITNVVNAVAPFSNNPTYAAISLSFYTISLLDSYGCLPSLLQRAYYPGLRKVVAVMPFFLLLRCFIFK